MKAIGEVENGAEEVIDAFLEYINDGLLIFPTHSWDRINKDSDIYDPITEPSCVGILSNLFLKRPGVIRSFHPTHSVAALGEMAANYVQGEERWDTPCSRKGCWGKLYDLKAKILFVGCSLQKNTIIHGVEEWSNIPERLSENPISLKIKIPGGKLIDRTLHTHYNPLGDISENYDKIEEALLKTRIATIGRIGDAKTYVCDVKKMVDLVTSFLKKNPDLFLDKDPIPAEWY